MLKSTAKPHPKLVVCILPTTCLFQKPHLSYMALIFFVLTGSPEFPKESPFSEEPRKEVASGEKSSQLSSVIGQEMVEQFMAKSAVKTDSHEDSKPGMCSLYRDRAYLTSPC